MIDIVSLYDSNDRLTKWDSESYIIITRGVSEERVLVKKNMPSIMLHEIDDYIRTWGCTMYDISSWVDMSTYKSFNNSIFWSGLLFVRIDINTYHTDMISLDSSNWFDYKKESFRYRFDEWVERTSNALISNGKDNIPLKREIHLRSLLKDTKKINEF